MKSFVKLPTLIGICLVQTALSQGNIVPTTEQRIVERDIANLTFYSIDFYVNAPILRFESTLIVPSASPDPDIPGAVSSMWPGIQSDTLLQNVVTHQGDGPQEWQHFPFYCCHPAGQLKDSVWVYPGDLIINSYILGGRTNKWFDNWVVTPGEEGQKAGTRAFSGSLTFDQSIALIDQGGAARPYSHAVLAIETQGQGKWDFGLVTTCMAR